MCIYIYIYTYTHTYTHTYTCIYIYMYIYIYIYIYSYNNDDNSNIIASIIISMNCKSIHNRKYHLLINFDVRLRRTCRGSARSGVGWRGASRRRLHPFATCSTRESVEVRESTRVVLGDIQKEGGAVFS